MPPPPPLLQRTYREVGWGFVEDSDEGGNDRAHEDGPALSDGGEAVGYGRGQHTRDVVRGQQRSDKRAEECSPFLAKLSRLLGEARRWVW